MADRRTRAAKFLLEEGDPTNATPVAGTILRVGKVDTGEYLVRNGDTIEGFTPSRICAYDSAGTGAFSAAQVVVFNGTHVTHADFTLAGTGIITVNATGRYVVDYSVTIEGASAGTRTNCKSLLALNSSGTPIAGTLRSMIGENNQYGNSAACNIVLDLTSGDTLEVVVGRSNGTGTLQMYGNGALITVTRIS